MTQQDFAALLGRPLTAVEISNFELYKDIALESVEQLLCISLLVQGDDVAATPRQFDTREGYDTVFTDMFTSVESVDGLADYYPAFWDSRNSNFYNSVVFGKSPPREVTITAKWGFAKLPNDLKRLVAAVFDNISRQNKLDREVNSKKVEDFTITYNHSSITMGESLMDNLIKDYAHIISKYRLCSVGYVRHGAVCK